jgi:hypothetical protein
MRLCFVVAVVLASRSGFATCVPAKSFASFNAVEGPGYFYVHMGTNTTLSHASILGRLWQPGARATANEGTYDESNWLAPATFVAPDAFYVDGTLGDSGVVGCPTGEMLMLLEDRTTDGTDAVLAVARVDETPIRVNTFDYARFARDIITRPYPRVFVLPGDFENTVDLAFDDVASGFYGLAGMVPQGTITGYRLYRKEIPSGQPTPGRAASGWEFSERIPYTGVAPARIGYPVNCTSGDLALATGLEFDNGQVHGVWVGPAVRFPCRCTDTDADGVCDTEDNCDLVANAGQANADGDAQGDACDVCPLDAANDADADGRCANVDNCPTVANPDQADADGDAVGDACDPCPGDTGNDPDGDGICAAADNCDGASNPTQTDLDADGLGDACDPCPTDAGNDPDGDGRCAAVDNCPAVPNASQADADADGRGDACDNCPSASNVSQIDSDGDGRGNSCDNCVGVPNAAQTDSDADGLGNSCDNCVLDSNPGQQDLDADRVGDACDNCLAEPNPSQADADADRQGDRCDLDDGTPFLTLADHGYFEWHVDVQADAWNAYRGSLAVLRGTGVYTQSPGTNPLAARECGLVMPFLWDEGTLGEGEAAFWLVTLVDGGVESGLGNATAGSRANTDPCP